MVTTTPVLEEYRITRYTEVVSRGDCSGDCFFKVFCEDHKIVKDQQKIMRDGGIQYRERGK